MGTISFKLVLEVQKRRAGQLRHSALSLYNPPVADLDSVDADLGQRHLDDGQVTA